MSSTTVRRKNIWCRCCSTRKCSTTIWEWSRQMWWVICSIPSTPACRSNEVIRRWCFVPWTSVTALWQWSVDYLRGRRANGCRNSLLKRWGVMLTVATSFGRCGVCPRSSLSRMHCMIWTNWLLNIFMRFCNSLSANRRRAKCVTHVLIPPVRSLLYGMLTSIRRWRMVTYSWDWGWQPSAWRMGWTQCVWNARMSRRVSRISV